MKVGKLLKGMLVFSVVATGSCQLDAQSYNLKEMNLNGKVKKVLANEYPVDEATVGKKRSITSVFDINGNKVSEVICDEDGNFLYKAKMEYNVAGYLVTEFSSNKITLQVDMVKRYTYDKHKRLAGTKLFNHYKQLISKVSYTYNEDDLLLLTVNVDDAGKELARTACVYDDQGWLLEERELDSRHVLLNYSRYQYDAHGRKIAKTDYDKNGFKDFISEYTYDEYGNLSSELSNYTGGTSTLIEYHYDYDRNKNWTRMREEMNERTYAVTNREIETWK